MSNQITINFGIDCDPFCRHQEDGGRYIFENILKREYHKPRSAFFGCWEWEDVKVTEEENKQIAIYLANLYLEGHARGVACTNLKRYVTV